MSSIFITVFFHTFAATWITKRCPCCISASERNHSCLRLGFTHDEYTSIGDWSHKLCESSPITDRVQGVYGPCSRSHSRPSRSFQGIRAYNSFHSLIFARKETFNSQIRCCSSMEMSPPGPELRIRNPVGRRPAGVLKTAPAAGPCSTGASSGAPLSSGKWVLLWAFCHEWAVQSFGSFMASATVFVFEGRVSTEEE